MVSKLRHVIRQGEEASESGQALIEYALILMLISFIAFGALEVLGEGVVEALGEAAAGFGGA